MPRVLVLLLVLVLATACQPRLTPEQRALRSQTRAALLAQSYRPAAESARRVLEFLPRQNDAWDDLVQAEIGLQDFTAAQATLKKWRAAIPTESPRRWELEGDLALAQKNSPLALGTWAKSLALRPRQPRLLQKIADLHEAAQDWRQTEEALTKSLALQETAATFIDRALIRRRQQHWTEALADLRRAQELQPNAPEVRRATELFERVGKFLTAIHDLSARLAITPADDQLLGDRALLFLRAGDPELALADGAAAARLAPWAMRPRLFQGLALLALDRRPAAEALGLTSQTRLETLTPEFLETISRIDSDLSVERSNPELYVTRAWQLNDIGQPALARQDAESALRFDTENAGAHAELAYALAKLGQTDEAFAQIQRATELDANFSTAWHYRGALELARGQLEAAVDSLSRALAINQTPAALQKREECYIKLGQLEKAEADHKAIEALK